MSTRTHAALKRLMVSTALLVALVAIGAASTDRAQARATPCEEAGRAPQAAALNDLRGSMLCLINKIRDHYGLEGLSENAPLRRSATGHSHDMVAHGYLAHDGSAGSTLGSRVAQAGYLARVNFYAVGENIGGGIGRARGSALAVFQGWMQSPPHRANILDPEFHDLGIGVVRGFPAGGGTTAATYTLDFGMRR